MTVVMWHFLKQPYRKSKYQRKNKSKIDMNMKM